MRVSRLTAGCCLALLQSGCIGISYPWYSFTLQRSRMESAMFPAPVHITEDDSASWVRLASSVSIDSRGEVTDFPSPMDVGRIDSLSWRWPRVQADLALDLAPTPHLAVSGALAAGRVGGRTMWSNDLSFGVRWSPGPLCLRTDVGLRSRRSRYAVSYVERYVESEGATARVAVNRVRGTGHHQNLYAAFTLNSRRPGDSLNWFLGADVGGLTTLVFEVETTLVEGSHAEHRGEALLGVSGGVYRRVGGWGRALTGMRYGFVTHGATGSDALGEPSTVTHVRPFGELVVRLDLAPGFLWRHRGRR